MRTINFDLEEAYRNLLKEAEGAGFDGMVQPIWAQLENDNLTLSLGAPVSRNTSFVNPDGSVAKSWVGNVACWKFDATSEDYEEYGFESPEEFENFDRDILIYNEIERLMPYVYLESIKEVISAFCESKGYKVEFV